MHIGLAKSLAGGFAAMIMAEALFSIVSLMRVGDPWLGLLYLLILLIPLSTAGLLWRQSRRNRMETTLFEHMSNVLFALLGIALACWAYDLATTFYAIDIAKVATEINPLGWPWGALGALSYYGPTVSLTYVLLSRIKQKTSLYAAIPIAIVALMMGSMNLRAGIDNFQFFIQTAHLSTAIRMDLLVLVVAADLAYVLFLASIHGKLAFGLRRLGSVKKN